MTGSFCVISFLIGQGRTNKVNLNPIEAIKEHKEQKEQERIYDLQQADILIIIGTSMQVYPAAGLISYAQPNIPIYFIDPMPRVSPRPNLTVIAEKASIGVAKAFEQIESRDKN